MGYKELKKDLIYALKRFQKEGMTIVVHDENLDVVAGKYQPTSQQLDPLEALVLVKGWDPLPELLTYLASCHRAAEAHEEFQKYMRTAMILMFDSEESHRAYLLDAPKVPSVETPLGYSESSYLYPLIEKQAEMTRLELYGFLDGLDWVVESEYKTSPFYEVGVYVREKFAPVGARTEPLITKVDQEQFLFLKGPIHKKFVVQTRGAMTILEVECQEIRDMLPPHAMSYKILSPQSLYEKKPSGQMVPPTYAPHSVHADKLEARVSCQRMILSGFEFGVRKGRITSFTEDEVEAKVAEVKTVML